MHIDDLHKTLLQLGANIGKSTIRKYTTEYGLAPETNSPGLGRGKGRDSIYSDEALAQIYAAWKLLNGKIQTNRKTLTKVRQLAQDLIKSETLAIGDSILNEMNISAEDLGYLIELWINYYEEAKPKPMLYRVDIAFTLKHIHYILNRRKFPRITPRNLI